ncbi:hypothetical protein Hanom_Chr09g00801921 [Helianthus anomalus]
MLVMKNQYMNHVDENFQLKDPTKRPDKFVMELGSTRFDKVGNKFAVANWSGHQEYYAKESQFESWTKIDLKSLLRVPYHDLEPNQRGRDWAFHSRLEKEVKSNFAMMKTTLPTVKRNPGVRDPHTKRTVMSVIWLATDEKKIILINKKV